MEVMDEGDITNAVNQLFELRPEIGEEIILESIPSECNELGEKQIQESKKDDSTNRCPSCGKIYTKICNLRRHMVNLHGMSSVDMNNYKIHIKCAFDANCTACFSRIAFYRQHLVLVHGVKLEKVTMNFSSLNEFLEWKAVEENETQFRFNRFSYKEGVGKIKKRSYICCRSGKHFSKGNKKKSMKIGTYCPAKMDIVYNHKKLILTYFKTHVGHGALHEIYATSERKRMQAAARRQKKQYENLKAEVKAKVDRFLDNLSLNKYSAEFLKSLSKTLNSVFDPDMKSESNKVDKQPESHEFADVCMKNGPDVIKPPNNYIATNNTMNEHGYVCTNNLLASKKQLVSTTQGNSSKPVVVYASKEKIPDTHSSPKNEINATGNSGTKTMKVLLLHTPKSVEGKKPIKSIVFLNKSNSVIANQTAELTPVLLLGKDSVNFLQARKTEVDSNILNCNVDSTNPSVKNHDSYSDNCKSNPIKADKFITKLKSNNCVVNPLTSKQPSQVISVKHDYSASNNLVSSSQLKRNVMLLPNDKFESVSNTSHFLSPISLTNSCENVFPLQSESFFNNVERV